MAPWIILTLIIPVKYKRYNTGKGNLFESTVCETTKLHEFNCWFCEMELFKTDCPLPVMLVWSRKKPFTKKKKKNVNSVRLYLLSFYIMIIAWRSLVITTPTDAAHFKSMTHNRVHLFPQLSIISEDICQHLPQFIICCSCILVRSSGFIIFK